MAATSGCYGMARTGTTRGCDASTWPSVSAGALLTTQDMVTATSRAVLPHRYQRLPKALMTMTECLKVPRRSTSERLVRQVWRSSPVTFDHAFGWTIDDG